MQNLEELVKIQTSRAMVSLTIGSQRDSVSLTVRLVAPPGTASPSQLSTSPASSHVAQANVARAMDAAHSPTNTRDDSVQRMHACMHSKEKRGRGVCMQGMTGWKGRAKEDVWTPHTHTRRGWVWAEGGNKHTQRAPLRQDAHRIIAVRRASREREREREREDGACKREGRERERETSSADPTQTDNEAGVLSLFSLLLGVLSLPHRERSATPHSAQIDAGRASQQGDRMGGMRARG